MAANKYYQTILDTLQGQTANLRDVPAERLDWAGPGALLDLYDRTSGKERSAMIRAMGQIIHRPKAPPRVIAQLVDIASSLGIAEVEPDVRALEQRPITRQEPTLNQAVINYLAYRQLQPGEAVSAREPKPARRGKPRASKSKDADARAKRRGRVHSAQGPSASHKPSST